VTVMGRMREGVRRAYDTLPRRPAGYGDRRAPERGAVGCAGHAGGVARRAYVLLLAVVLIIRP
jgi:hypothetical protein